MAQVEQRTGKVDDWKTSDQKQRWLATALLDIEPRLRRVKGDRFLLQPRVALQQTIAKGGRDLHRGTSRISTEKGIDLAAIRALASLPA